jgi:putative FmdB family regulatory protein
LEQSAQQSEILMPIYEYRCRQCGEAFNHHFRTLRAAEEEGTPLCPACGVPGAQRLVSSVAALGGAAGGGGGESEGTAAETTTNKLFGRKELKKALDDRGY